MWDKIYNPLISKWINLKSKKGSQILQNYITNLQYGGTLAENITPINDVHFTEEKLVRRIPIKCAFFDYEFREDWNTDYIINIENDPMVYDEVIYYKWYLQISDTLKVKLRNDVVIPDDSNPIQGTINFNKDKKYFIERQDIIKFLKYFKLPENTKQDSHLVKEKLSTYPVILKNYTEREPSSFKYYLNQLLGEKPCSSVCYSSVLFISDNDSDNFEKPVAVCTSEIMDDYEIKHRTAAHLQPSSNFNLYIANVDVHPSYRGMGLCKPVISYMIKNLKRLGYRFLYIDNSSKTNSGQPACFCYYKAGINNDYTIQYGTKNNTFKDMELKHCIDKGISQEPYYYTLESNEDTE